MINDYHVISLNIASREQLDVIYNLAASVNNILKELFSSVDIILVDFKLEFGFYKDKIILADEISPDTCRLWDLETNEKLDKDRFRRDLGNVEDAYKEVLKRLGIN